MMSLFKGIFDRAFASMTSEDRAPKFPDMADVVRDGVLASKLTKGREGDVQFYIAARKAGKLVGGRCRTFGEPLSTEAKREMGLPTRPTLTFEFVETLGDAARADPVAAAWRIAVPVDRHLQNTDCLRKLASMDGMKAQFLASNMAAGPCQRAAELDDEIFEPHSAPIPPFENCSHPDQCSCSFRARFEIE